MNMKPVSQFKSKRMYDQYTYFFCKNVNLLDGRQEKIGYSPIKIIILTYSKMCGKKLIWLVHNLLTLICAQNPFLFLSL